MTRILAFAALVVFFSGSALAQESAFPSRPGGMGPAGPPPQQQIAPSQQQIDPRIAGPAMTALRAQMALLDAALKASMEDGQKREKDWAEYLKPIDEALKASVESTQKREADLAEWFKGWFSKAEGEAKASDPEGE